MRFLTYNLWHGLSPSATPLAFEALEPSARRILREEMQLETLARLDPDVSFFQEVNPVGRRGAELASALKASYVSQPDLVGLKLFGIGLPINLNSGLLTAISKRWTTKKLEAISLSRPGLNLVHHWASWQLREERFAVFTETMLPNWGRVLLVNTHLHHGIESSEDLLLKLEGLAKELELSEQMVSELRDRLRKGNERRALEFKTLMNKIAGYRRKYAAVLLAGDFNSTPQSELSSKLKEEGFLDVWHETNPSEAGLTFDGIRNKANHLLQARFPLTLVVEDLSFSAKVKESLLALAREQEMRARRIDYLWLHPGTLNVRFKKAELIGLPDSDGLAPSDHFGVCADLEVG